MFFFFNDTATTEIYTLSLHDALPIWIEIIFHLHRDAALLRDVTPARAGEFDDLQGQLIEADRQQRLVLLAFPVEVAHPRDDVGDVVAGGFDVGPISVGGLTEVLLVPEEQ